MHPNRLQRLCISCLKAFGLTLDSRSDQPPLRILKEGESSLVVRARVTQGDIPRDVVLKGTSLTEFRQPPPGLEAMLADTDKGVTIPSRLLTESGESFHIDRSDSFHDTAWSVTTYEENGPVFDWLSKESQPWSAAQTRSAGALLANLHAASYSIREHVFERGVIVEPSITHQVPQLLLAAFDDVSAEYKASIGLEHLGPQRLVAIVNRAVVTLEGSVHARTLAREETIVHGDYQPGNVLYRDGQAFALVDWDYARIDHPLLDVAYGLIMFAGNLTVEHLPPLDTNLSRHFLQGYADQIADRKREPVCMPDCYFTPDVRDNHVFSSYMKLAGALVMLWSLSEYGQQHPCGVTVARQISRLMQTL